MIELGTGTLTCEQIVAIARSAEHVTLAPTVVQRLADSHAAVLRLAAAGPVYGRSTGVGALLTARLMDVQGALPADRVVAAPTPASMAPASTVPVPTGPVSTGPVSTAPSVPGHPDGLLRSHATTAGPPLPAEHIRAMTAVRVEQIAVGRSGLGPGTAAGLVNLLNDNHLPIVGRFNSLGTGDVAPLARLALTLPDEALDQGDGLALMSSNALTIGRAALAVVDLDRLLSAATVVTAFTYLARDGAAGALHAQAAGPFAGPRRIARVLRRLGAGSRVPARLQDQYGLRAAPQTLGIAVDGAATLREVATALARAGLENPLVMSDRPASVVHHGGFHAVHLTAALDGAALGLARAAVGSVNRLALLTEPPPVPADLQQRADSSASARAFLAGGPLTASGIMVLEYTAAAALGTVRGAAIPAATQTAGLSRGIEQDATYAPLAADQLEEAIEAARVLVAVELVAAVRAIRLRGLTVPTPLSDSWQVCTELPTEMDDRDLTDDVRIAERLLDLLAPFGTDTGDDQEQTPPRPDSPHPYSQDGPQ